MQEERKTLGQQIIDNWGSTVAPECREVTNMFWHKKLQPLLKETIEKHKNYSPKIYILVNLRNSVLLGANAKHFTVLVNHEEWPPKASAMQYSYDYKSGELLLIWVLPDEGSIDEIVDIPETYDPKLVADCHRYKKAKRILIQMPE
jgi:hypothetical protein